MYFSQAKRQQQVCAHICSLAHQPLKARGSKREHAACWVASYSLKESPLLGQLWRSLGYPRPGQNLNTESNLAPGLRCVLMKNILDPEWLSSPVICSRESEFIAALTT